MTVDTPATAPNIEWHRRTAIDAFNHAWDLIEKEDRSPEDDREMLASAFVSRFHWRIVGEPERRWAADWQIARIASLLGHPSLALYYAAVALAEVEDRAWTGWQLASAREGMARAHAAAGEGAERDRLVALAAEALEAESEPEEREIIAGQLATVPVVA